MPMHAAIHAIFERIAGIQLPFQDKSNSDIPAQIGIYPSLVLPIQRTHHPAPALVQHMGVDHRRRNIGMLSVVT